MTDPYALYPSTNSYPFLLVSFSEKRTIGARPFATEEEAEAFIEQAARERNER